MCIANALIRHPASPIQNQRSRINHSQTTSSCFFVAFPRIASIIGALAAVSAFCVYILIHIGIICMILIVGILSFACVF